MLVLIEKDSATRIQKEVTPEQAQALAAQFPVAVIVEGGMVPFAAWQAAQSAPKKTKKKR